MCDIKTHIECVETKVKEFVSIDANNHKYKIEIEANNNSNKIEFITRTYLAFYFNEDIEKLDKTKLFSTIKLIYNDQITSTISNKLAHSLLYLYNNKSAYPIMEKMLNSNPIYFPTYFTSHQNPLMITKQHLEFELDLNSDLNLDSDSNKDIKNYYKKIELVYDVITTNSEFCISNAYPSGTIPFEIYSCEIFDLETNPICTCVNSHTNSHTITNPSYIQNIMWYYTNNDNNFINPVEKIDLEFIKKDDVLNTEKLIFISSHVPCYYKYIQQYSYCAGEYENVYMYSFVLNMTEPNCDKKEGLMSKNHNDLIKFEQILNPDVDFTLTKKITQTIFVKSIVEIPIFNVCDKV